MHYFSATFLHKNEMQCLVILPAIRPILNTIRRALIGFALFDQMFGKFWGHLKPELTNIEPELFRRIITIMSCNFGRTQSSSLKGCKIMKQYALIANCKSNIWLFIWKIMLMHCITALFIHYFLILFWK